MFPAFGADKGAAVESVKLALEGLSYVHEVDVFGVDEVEV
jgi:hypothetical protein